MASFKIHEDQENRRPELRQKDVVKTQLQQKRTVLGVLDNKPVQLANKSKQIAAKAFGDLKINDENALVVENIKKTVPIVPVAQFEAFKVYEDKVEIETEPKQERKIEQKEKENICIKNDENEVKQELLHVHKPLSTPDKLVRSHSRISRDLFLDMPEYRGAIHSYLRQAEQRCRPRAGYMRKQPDITPAMRQVLVDWLVEVAEEYRLQTETLYLAVNYIDRFLSYMSVVRAKLQLVGTAAMFIAAKYEEIYPPDVGEFVYITDDTYNKKQVLRMEQLILKVLAFDLSTPTPLTFLTAYCAGTRQPDKITHLAMYACELSTLDADTFLQYVPSVLAASSVLVSRELLCDEVAWSRDLQNMSGYSCEELGACASALRKALAEAPSSPQQAVQDKYKQSKYHHVALTPVAT